MNEELNGWNPGGCVGETILDISSHAVFGGYTPNMWAMKFIEMYGQIDGGHHKAWVLDQVSRILKGTPVVVTEARWESGYKEYRFRTGNPSEDYINWVQFMLGEVVDDAYEYDYDEGVAP